jgi:predicted kinase
VPHVALVSGAPGSGKSTLAHPLAAQLDAALLSKDRIKETLYDALNGSPADLAFSRQIGGAAMHVLWTVAATCPRVVLEANFRPNSNYERQRIADLGATVVEVHCRCPSEEAGRRFRERAAAQHPAHPLSSLSPDALAEYDRPIGMGPVIEVDTTRPVNIDAIVEQVRALWQDP